MRMRLAVLGVAGLMVGATRCADDPAEAETEAASHLTQRLWVERLPDNERDMIRKLAFVRSIEHGRFGVVERGSVWRHRIEVLKWGMHDGRLRMYFPQDRTQLGAKVRTWECEAEAPDGLELCLEIRIEGGQTLRMYSRHDWVLPPRASQDIVDDGLGAWDLGPRATPAHEAPDFESAPVADRGLFEP